MKYLITFRGIKLEVEQLPNGKFKKPDLGLFTKQGLGSVWLDEGRIPYKSEKDKYDVPRQDFSAPQKAGSLNKIGVKTHNLKTYRTNDRDIANIQGRFPANLLCSDDVLNDGKIRHCPVTKGITTSGKAFWHKEKPIGYKSGFPDSGSFSRYFSLDTWFDKKLKELSIGVQKTFPFLIVPKASKTEKNRGCEGLEKELGHNRFDKCKNCDGYILQNPSRPSACKCDKPEREHNKIKGNFHPTVKPIKLMSYLITLGSRKNDVILDPFIGSGTTAIASKKSGRHYIGFEINKEYCKIAQQRLEAEKILWDI